MSRSQRQKHKEKSEMDLWANFVFDEETESRRNYPEDYSDENGNYLNQCLLCGNHFKGNKHRNICKVCDIKQ